MKAKTAISKTAISKTAISKTAISKTAISKTAASEKELALNKFDYSVRPRDSRVKAEFPGAWMVIDNIDGQEGFAIVGDDRDELVNEAYEFLNLPQETP